MIYRTDKVIEGPWKGLSLDAFFYDAKASQADMKAMFDAILYAQYVFQNTRILPSQGDRIASSLHVIRTAILDLLSLTAHMPEALSPSRYPLMSELYKVDSLLNDLLVFLLPSQTSSQTSSYDSPNQRQKIQRRFVLLHQAFEDMLQELSIVLDKANYLKGTAGNKNP